MDFQEKITEMCMSFNDAWSASVKGRPEASIVESRRGRLINSARNGAFLEEASYLERNDDEQVTINGLVGKMREFCGDECYTPFI